MSSLSDAMDRQRRENERRLAQEAADAPFTTMAAVYGVGDRVKPQSELQPLELEFLAQLSPTDGVQHWAVSSGEHVMFYKPFNRHDRHLAKLEFTTAAARQRRKQLIREGDNRNRDGYPARMLMISSWHTSLIHFFYDSVGGWGSDVKNGDPGFGTTSDDHVAEVMAEYLSARG
jgi:hypothetical protein